MTEMDLLKALNDIDEQWIADAGRNRGPRENPEGAEVISVVRKRRNSSGIIKAAAAVTAAAAAVTALLVSSSVIRKNKVQNSVTVYEKDAAYETAAEEEDGRILLQGQQFSYDDAAEEAAPAANSALEAGRNPFIQYEKLSEAEDAAGFSFKVPDKFAGSSKREFYCTNFGMMQIVYEDSDGEELFRIRKQAGSGDISGDYNSYSTAEQLCVDGCEVHMAGDEKDCISVATWEKDGYCYALDAGIYLFTEEEVSEIVSSAV